MRRSRHNRGSVLFTVLIVVLAITLLGTALVVGSGRHLAGARLHETSNGLANCALAVRQYLAANIASGTALSSLNFTVSAGGGYTIKLTGGHYDTADGGFSLPAGAAFGTGGGSTVQNIANAMPMTLSGSTPQQVGTAICTDPDSRTYEVEFSWR